MLLYRPELIPFSTLAKENCSHNLGLAFKVGDDIGIPALLGILIYLHFFSSK